MKKILIFTLFFLIFSCSRENSLKTQSQTAIKYKKLFEKPKVKEDYLKKKYDYKGELKQSEDKIAGFPLPVGSFFMRKAGKVTKFSLTAPVEKVKRFYQKRGFVVFKKKDGYLVYFKDRVRKKPYLAVNKLFATNIEILVYEK